jgi:sterol desaturase/sphingolipid hydroxylase (fatty acid hydroxylase superfamily)
MSPTTLREAIDPSWLPWLGALLAVLLLAATIEGLVLSWRSQGSYDWRAFFSSLGDAVLRRGVEGLGLTLASPLLVWAWENRLTTIPLDSAWAFLLLFLGQELCYYGYHRAAHRVRWFWATHAVHHSPNQLTLATAARLGFTGRLTGTVLFFVPMVWLGFAPVAVFATLAVNLLYQFWIHAAWIPRLWWPIEWVFNTPAHHRVHHASNHEYLDCNYGGVLVVFDRLFGSLVEEQPGNSPRYGLTTPLSTYNPLRVALHEWINLGRDLRQARDLKACARALFGPPGSTSTGSTPPSN